MAVTSQMLSIGRWIGVMLSKGTHVNEEGEVGEVGGDYEPKFSLNWGWHSQGTFFKQVLQAEREGKVRKR